MSEKINNPVESIERVRGPEGYFSVSHLLHKVQVESEDGASPKEYFVVVEGNSKDGKIKYQAFGGGAKLTEQGINNLKETHGENIRFREGVESDDARFYISLPEDLFSSGGDTKISKEQSEFISTVLKPFLDLRSGYIEETVERELEEEFTETLGNIDWDLSRLTYQGVVSPIQGEKSGSTRSDGAIVYHRIFHLYDLELSPYEFAQLTASPKVKVLTQADKDAVRKATLEGKALAELPDGSLLAENVFPYDL